MTTVAAGLSTDIRAREVALHRVACPFRTPLKFGAVVMKEFTLLMAHVAVETRSGRRGEGWGAMPLAALWAWPVAKAESAARTRAMYELAEAYGRSLKEYDRFGHPIELFMETEPELDRLSAAVCGVEANSRQYTPVSNEPEAAVHPGIFRIRNGVLRTDSLRGPGLGFRMSEIPRHLVDSRKL